MANGSELDIRRDRAAVTTAPGAAAVMPDAAALRAATELLKAAERYTSARRPIVLHGPAPAVHSPAPGHPGINVTIPGPAAPAAEPAEDLPRLFTRAEVSFYMAAATIGAGGVGFAVDQVSGPAAGFVPVLGAFWLLISAAAINRWAARHGGIEVVHGRVKPRGRT